MDIILKEKIEVKSGTRRFVKLISYFYISEFYTSYAHNGIAVIASSHTSKSHTLSS